ncbi:hypothetical protein BX616_008607, partial [Lobosporangium transversale]
MSSKSNSVAPSSSITNLANKVINRIANNSNSNNNSNHNNSSHNTMEEEEDSGENEDDEDAGIIRCICNYTDDDGFTIQCERCLVWQHAVCVGIGQSNVPDKYLCELCSPRSVDRKRANEIQRRRNGTLERKREKSPSRKKPTVGRPRKQFGSANSALSDQNAAPGSTTSNSKENGAHHSVGSNSVSNGFQGKNPSMSIDVNGRRSKGATSNKHSQLQSHSNPSPLQHSSNKHKSAGQANGSKTSSNINDDEDLDMENDGHDTMGAYQVEFSSIDTNIVTSKPVQDLFRQVIAQFRQAQSRKRSLSLTSGVKLHELVAASANTGSNNTQSSIGTESTESSSGSLGSQLPPTPPTSNTDPSNVVSMERESLARPLMKTTVKHILSSSKSTHSPTPQYGLFAESNIGAGRFMMEFKGEVSLKSAYKADPINQYSILATPKPFVLFHPHLNLVVDARRSGNDARFVRRSCVPNTEVKSIVVPGVQDQTVHLGLFAKVPIAKGQEITLDWDWNRDHPALQPIGASSDKPKDNSVKRNTKEIRKAKHLVASTLLAQTDCACENKETCLLHRMLRDGMSESGARDHETPTTTKGNRPKKGTTAESLRQRYGNQRDRPDGKRSADQETSDEDLSIAGSSPRRKSPKASKLESSSKKARHEASPNNLRSNREQDMESDSDSDDQRRRKQPTSERVGSPPKRSNLGSPEMSVREMKQALIQIKKMEDRDAAHAGHAKQKPAEAKLGVTSKSRTRSKGRSQEVEQKPSSSHKNTNAIEDDDVSIGDSGIDSDSNNRSSQKDSFLARNKQSKSQGKWDMEQWDQDMPSHSSAASDSDRTESSSRVLRRASSISSEKKQPYTAASRGKRMANYSASESLSKKRSTSHTLESQDDLQNISRSSSMDGSFVSILGNTSDEEGESFHETERRVLREKNLPKETFPTVSLRSSALPCKKVWKMIYLKQRALAEAEALERAEEMRKKAEEVFDIKMEESDVSINGSNVSTVANDPTAVELPSSESDDALKRPKEPATFQPSFENDDALQPSIVEGDVLNLFHEDVKPENSSSGPVKRGHHLESRAEEKLKSRAPVIKQPVVIKPQESNAGSHTATMTDRLEISQKSNMEPYHAKRAVSNSPIPSKVSLEAAPTSIDTDNHVSNASESIDVEMSEPGPNKGVDGAQNASIAADHVSSLATSQPEPKVEAAPVIPKVKLSLQEYQKQRQEASQRNVYAESEILKQDKTGYEGYDDEDEAFNEASQEPVDIEMVESKGPVTLSVSEKGPSSSGDYFQVESNLPTPLIGLSSRTQSGSTSEYFPVQPFSPASLGPASFSKLNLSPSSPSRSSAPMDTSSRPEVDPSVEGRFLGKPPTGQRLPHSSSPRDPSNANMVLKSSVNKSGSSPPPNNPNNSISGWRTPRNQRGHSPPAPMSIGTNGNYRSMPSSEYRSMDARSSDARLASPRFFGSPSDRSERTAPGSLNSPARERQHSLTSGSIPSSPFEPNHLSSNVHYGYNEEPSFKRTGPLSSPTGHPGSSGPRDYYKGDERARHRSMNGDEWSYGDMDSSGYGGYRGPRGGPPPPPRDRDRERDREREHDRERERERRDRFDRRNDYFGTGPSGPGNGGGQAGNNGAGFYGSNRGPRGGPGVPGGIGGGYGRRPNDYFNGQGREEGYNGNGP